MAGASIRHARHRTLAAGCLIAILAALSACQEPARLEPFAPATPRHPIQAPAATVEPVSPSTPAGTDDGRITPGPNARITPTPDMAPRVAPTRRPGASSTQDRLEDLRRDLQEQHIYRRQEPGPPVGTIDLRPGTVHRSKGTIEVPK